MPEYDNTNRGALFLNDKQGVESRPEFTGQLEVKCPCCNKTTGFWMSGWKKTIGKGERTGEEMVSVEVQAKEPR